MSAASEADPEPRPSTGRADVYERVKPPAEVPGLRSGLGETTVTEWSLPSQLRADATAVSPAIAPPGTTTRLTAAAAPRASPS